MTTERRDRERRHTRGRRLTDRQTAVLEFVAAGLGNKEIAHELGISEQAVKEHVSNLLRLLAAPNRAALGEAAAMLQFVGTADLGPEWLGLLYLRAPLLIALLEGADHRFISVNEAYRRAAGPRELLGHTFRQAYPESHLVLGILYAEAGLLKDAERELDDIRENNHDFELAQSLLRNVRELREGR